MRATSKAPGPRHKVRSSADHSKGAQGTHKKAAAANTSAAKTSATKTTADRTEAKSEVASKLVREEPGKTPVELQAPEATREQRELLDASRPKGGGVAAGKGVLGFQLGNKQTLEDVRAQIAQLKASSTDPMTSSHMAEVDPAALTRLDLQAFQAIVVDKSPDWKEKTPAFEAYFADVKTYIDERRAQDAHFDALKDTRENFGAFLRHVVIIHAFEERLAARAAARSAQSG